MIRSATVLAALLLSQMLLIQPGHAAEQLFLTASSGRTRALAMGGAFTAVADNFFAAQGNPANRRERAPGAPEPRMVSCHINPLLPFAMANTDGTEDDGLSGPGRRTFAAIGLLKGLSIRYHALLFGVSLFESSPLATSRRRNPVFVNAEGLYENHSNTFMMNFRLAPSISMGASGSLYYQEDEGKRRYGGGISYGVLMKPSERLNIGLVYFNFPDEFQFLRQTGDRLSDETINGGMSYRITDNMLVALDLRNMTDDDNVGARELHLGVETAVLEKLALRAGFYDERANKNLVCSLGAGLVRGSLANLPWWNHCIDALDYSFVYETGAERVWHALTFVYTI